MIMHIEIESYILLILIDYMILTIFDLKSTTLIK